MKLSRLLLVFQGLIIGATLGLFIGLYSDFGFSNIFDNIRLNADVFINQYARASLGINFLAFVVATIEIIRAVRMRKQ